MGKVKVSLKPSLRALKTTLIKWKFMGKNIYDEEEEEQTRLGKTSSHKSWTFSCVQPKTRSFRLSPSDTEEDVHKSFNSLYIVSSDLKSSTRYSLCLARPEDEHDDANGDSKRTSVIICDENDMIFDDDTSSSYKNYFKWNENRFLDEEESLSLDMELTTSKASDYSSDSSSEASRFTEFPAGLARGPSLERLFFSPWSSNSILEEEKCLQTGAIDVTKLTVQADGGGGNIGIKRPVLQVDSISLETDRNLCWGIDTVNEEEGGCEESSDIMVCDILKDSLVMTTYSRDPYLDFKISMEEMVSAHDLRDWSCLQELLCCYLTLNNKKTHKFIVGAFADSLMNLILCKDSGHSLLDRGLSSTD